MEGSQRHGDNVGGVRRSSSRRSRRQDVDLNANTSRAREADRCTALSMGIDSSVVITRSAAVTPTAVQEPGKVGPPFAGGKHMARKQKYGGLQARDREVTPPRSRGPRPDTTTVSFDATIEATSAGVDPFTPPYGARHVVLPHGHCKVVRSVFAAGRKPRSRCDPSLESGGGPGQEDEAFARVDVRRDPDRWAWSASSARSGPAWLSEPQGRLSRRSRSCRPRVQGDGRFRSTRSAIIHVAFGRAASGSALVDTSPPSSTRSTAPSRPA